MSALSSTVKNRFTYSNTLLVLIACLIVQGIIQGSWGYLETTVAALIAITIYNTAAGFISWAVEQYKVRKHDRELQAILNAKYAAHQARELQAELDANYYAIKQSLKAGNE